MSEPKVSLKIGAREWRGDAAVRALWVIAIVGIAVTMITAMLVLAR